MRFYYYFPGVEPKEIRSDVVKSGRAVENAAAVTYRNEVEAITMNKILLGLVLGAVLGALDGLTALLTPDPAIRAGIVGIIIGSTGKGLLAGILCGIFARKVKSTIGGVVLGLSLGFLFALFVALNVHNYYFRIILPGSIVGLIVGFATQKYGAVVQPKQA